jgi:hypothetical protein
MEVFPKAPLIAGVPQYIQLIIRRSAAIVHPDVTAAMSRSGPAIEDVYRPPQRSISNITLFFTCSAGLEIPDVTASAAHYPVELKDAYNRFDELQQAGSQPTFVEEDVRRSPYKIVNHCVTLSDPLVDSELLSVRVRVLSPLMRKSRHQFNAAVSYQKETGFSPSPSFFISLSLYLDESLSTHVLISLPFSGETFFQQRTFNLTFSPPFRPLHTLTPLPQAVAIQVAPLSPSLSLPLSLSPLSPSLIASYRRHSQICSPFLSRPSPWPSPLPQPSYSTRPFPSPLSSRIM